jgi:hypothetical protein
MTYLYEIVHNILITSYSIPDNTKGITYEILAKFISSNTSVRKGGLGYTSSGGVNSFINKLFPEKPKYCSLLKYVLSTLQLKECSSCREIYSYAHFRSNISKPDDLAHYCKDCERDVQRAIAPARQAKRRARVLQAIPKWADILKIREIYKLCPKGYHVDHIVPLVSNVVCGLHCESNLQYLTAEENMQKSNKFIIVI